MLLLCLLGVLGPTAYYTFTTPPVYQTSTTIMVQDGGSPQRVLFNEGTFLGRTSNISDQVYLLKSRSIADLVVKKLMQAEVRDSLQILRQGFALAVQTLRQNLTAEPVKDTNFFIKIAVKGASPFEAAYLANTIATVYQNQDQQLSQGEIREVVQFLDEQLQKKEKDLKASEENLKNYQERENIASLSGDALQTVNQLAQFEALYNSALTDLQGYKKRLEFLNQQLGHQKETLTSNIAQISMPVPYFAIELAAGDAPPTVQLSDAEGWLETEATYAEQVLKPKLLDHPAGAAAYPSRNRRYGATYSARVNFDPERHMGQFGQGRASAFGENPPSSTLVGIDRLVNDGIQIEVDAVAVVGASGRTNRLTKEFLDGAGSFTQVVTVRGAGAKTIYVSGQVGRTSDPLEAQAQQAFAGMKRRLEAAGATPADLVKVIYYLPGYTPGNTGIAGAREANMFPTDNLPASTLLGIQSLYSTTALFEYEGIAVVQP